MTTDAALESLAQKAGLLVHWTDANGRRQKVAPDTLRSVLRALELPAESVAEIKASREYIRSLSANLSPLIIARVGEPLLLPHSGNAEIVLPDGKHIGMQTRGGEPKRITTAPGYYRLECEGEEHRIAIAPKRCLSPRDVSGRQRLSGIAVQIYSLRSGASDGFGDFAALEDFARQAGRFGFDAIMASPVHALFGADTGRFTPYSPSSRLFLNPLFANPRLESVSPKKYEHDQAPLVEWGPAGRAKLALLRRAFLQFRKQGDVNEFESFCREGGQSLLTHALFEVLDGYFRAKGIRGFRNWPSGFESPQAPAVRGFAHAATEELAYQLYLQWLATRSLAHAQKIARESMTIGIIADIAVGMDPEGSHAWSAPGELLRGLHVGAPPDMFNTKGQDWGLTTLSPRALEASGFSPFITTIRANMRHSGGVRIDHAMGLRRLWVIPDGASPADGVYLCYPQRELMNLLALESHLNRAIVIGEDLGTVPDGFRDDLAAAGILGMQVLWFERNSSGTFVSPSRWKRDAVAMTTTHDLPTVAGWWSGHDIKLQERAGILREDEQRLREERAAERTNLWSAFRRAKCASNPPPAPEMPEPAVEAALRFVARSRASIAFAALEDIVADVDQPNLPGTTSEHPNWRRRMRGGEPLRTKRAQERARAFVAARLGS